MSTEPPVHPSHPVVAPPHVLSLLERLHSLSSVQEASIGKDISPLVELFSKDPAAAKTQFDDLMRDKFIALDKDKAEFVYQTIRATGATTVVEAGTSFGVSTIYLALAVSANSPDGKVIATENEPTKAAKAREHWREAGEEVERFIELREGDLRETLKELPTVDFLLLDIWPPVALPALKLVEKRMRPGAVVVTDNTISSAERYKELLGYMRDPNGPFRNLTLPYAGGLEMSVYHPAT